MDTLALDRESAEWLRDLQDEAGAREEAAGRLHELLLRVARMVASRRRPTLPDHVTGDIDDLCIHAANDALMAVLAKLDTYRGTARFTTWACKFVLLEISARLRRHAWRERAVKLDDAGWDRMPDTAAPPLQRLEHDQVIVALHRAIDERLTDRQRVIFRCAAIDEVPIDVLAERLGTSRGAIYKTLHDARSKLRRALIDAGHGDHLT